MREYRWQSFKGLIFRNPAVVDQDPRVDDGDENTERGNWTSKREYILSMIGYAVGLGNIWRFPYLAYKNGGGAFLIPYFVMLVVVGIPLFFLESAFGQFCSQGPVNVWRAVPLIQGIGVAMVVVSVIVSIYYNVIIAYSLYYMFASMQCPLPWSGCSSCDGSNCSTTPEVSCNVSSGLVTNWTQENSSCSSIQTPSELYWDNVALQRSSGLDETGPVVWHLALCLLLSSILVTAALIRGIKSSGKVVYFTATFPYVVIVILLIRGVTLEGAKDGIEFYIGSQSNLTKLTEVQVWKDAATQTFYSLSIGWGGLMALASYNNFHNNVFKDSFVVTLTNAGTSVLAGFAIFSILGHMAHIYKTPVSKVVKEGIYWVTLIDQFVASWVLLFLVLLEIIAISYIYGGNRFIKDIEMMIGMKTSTFWLWWRACWFFISPCIIVFLLISSLVYFEPPNYGGIPYPDWGMTLGWCMIAFVLMWIPVVAGYKLIKAKGNPWKRLKSLCSPSEEWHPYLDVHRGERYSEERCHRRNNSKNKAEVNLNVISSSWL
ncbi:unnamed protein product [Oreochromis niloticus]|nr:unnamed protein product [Mustela putorius furo]